MVCTNRSIIKLILLSFITCGIYGIIFWWGVCRDLNIVCGDDGKSSPNFIVMVILSFITCGIYYYYWLYKQGNRMQLTAHAYGVTCQENGTTYILWELVGILICGIGPIIGTYLFLQNLNLLSNQYNIRMSAPRYY